LPVTAAIAKAKEGRRAGVGENRVAREADISNVAEVSGNAEMSDAAEIQGASERHLETNRRHFGISAKQKLFDFLRSRPAGADSGELVGLLLSGAGSDPS
jgi:hypothetical protein